MCKMFLQNYVGLRTLKLIQFLLSYIFILNGVRGSLVSGQRIVCAQVVVDVFKVKLSILTRVLQRQLKEITRVLI